MLTIPVAPNALILNLGLALHYLHRKIPWRVSFLHALLVWLGSHLVSEHGARGRFSVGTDVIKPPFPEFGNQSRPCTRVQDGTWVLGILVI